MNVEMKDYSGIAKAGLTTGIIGTGLGALNTLGDGLGGLLGGGGRMPACGGYGHADHAVNRFEFGMQMDFARELQAKDLEINALQSDRYPVSSHPLFSAFRLNDWSVSPEVYRHYVRRCIRYCGSNLDLLQGYGVASLHRIGYNPCL